MTEEGLIDNMCDIKKAFFDHFYFFLGSSVAKSPFHLPDGFLSKLSLASKHDLVRPFSLPEIEAALNSMEPSKAPGPDGLNAGVLKTLWDHVKEDFLDFFSNFRSSGFIVPSLNSSF